MDENWVPVPGAPEMVDEKLFANLDIIDEVTHPLRGRIVYHLRQPHSVAELAANLDVPVTRLYHHIKRLEELGMIAVVATRRAGVVTERQYRNVARDFRIDQQILRSADPETIARVIGSVFDIARADFQREVRSGALVPGEVTGRAEINFSELTLSEEHLVDFVGRMQQLFAEFAQLDDIEGIRFRLLVAGFPLTD